MSIKKPYNSLTRLSTVCYASRTRENFAQANFSRVRWKPVRKFPFQTESKICNTFDIFCHSCHFANRMR